jgi:hypothetical protein
MEETKELVGISHIVFACDLRSNNALYEAIKDYFQILFFRRRGVSDQKFEAVRNAWEMILAIS